MKVNCGPIQRRRLGGAWVRISTCESHLSSEGAHEVGVVLVATVEVVVEELLEELVEMAEEEGVNSWGGATAA